jgi:hypothetical protein
MHEGHSSVSSGVEFQSGQSDLLIALQQVLEAYLKEVSTRSLNGLSRRCTVSEPTLRRILRGQIKTLPTSTTILDILTNLSGEKNTSKLALLYPGPIAEYLKNLLPQSQDCQTEYDTELNHELQDGVKYIIYKLCSNSCGLEKSKLHELYGAHGEKTIAQLVQKGYVREEGDVYFSSVTNFTISNDHFVENFKLLADYIKVQVPCTSSSQPSLLANYSESVSMAAFKQITALQKSTLRKIRNIMSKDESKGTVPVFLLLAIDTLDSQRPGKSAL